MAQQGAPAELMEQGGLYRRMVGASERERPVAAEQRRGVIL